MKWLTTRTLDGVVDPIVVTHDSEDFDHLITAEEKLRVAMARQ